LLEVKKEVDVLSLPLTITTVAQTHFKKLIEQQDNALLHLRMFVVNPGLPHAEVGITFCPEGYEQPDDIRAIYPDLTVFIEQTSLPFLKNALIDYQTNEVGEGHLIIKAPLLKGKPLATDASFAEQLEHVLATEVNPMLAAHKGFVSLVEIVSQHKIILEFGGGCQGCGMAVITLKTHVERIIKERFPMIEEIVDNTEHAAGKNPYM